MTRYGIMNSDPSWYKARLPYVKRYIESLRQQTYKDFQVLLLVDDSIPPECLTDLNRLAFDDRMDISKRGAKDPFDEPTLQIRIDSDDYIANDFVEKVVKHAKPGHVLHFVNGYIERNGRFYEKKYAHNMFLALWARESVYQTAHDLMHKRYETIPIEGDSMWIHVWHETATTWDKNKDKELGQEAKPDRKRFAFLDKGLLN